MMTTLERLRRRLDEHEPRRVPESVAPKRAAVAAVLGGRRSPELLLIRRAERPGDPWSGHMGLPGGRREAGESDLEAACRETREEVGIELAESALIGALNEVQAVGRGRPLGLAIAPFIFHLDDSPTLKPDPREVAETLWVPLDWLARPEHLETMTYEGPGGRRELPCWTYKGRRIWGLTFLMIRELLQYAEF